MGKGMERQKPRDVWVPRDSRFSPPTLQLGQEALDPPHPMPDPHSLLSTTLVRLMTVHRALQKLGAGVGRRGRRLRKVTGMDSDRGTQH